MKDNLRYLNALLNGDSSEIALLYQKSFPQVRKFVLQNNGSVFDAEDIFQKALLQIAVRYKKDKFEIKSTFEGYLYTVCKNLWRRELNKSKRMVTNYTVDEQGDNNDSHDMAMAALEQKKWDLFSETLEALSENCKKVLQLFFSKVSYSEMVKRLNYSSETVARQRVFKCKAK